MFTGEEWHRGSCRSPSAAAAADSFKKILHGAATILRGVAVARALVTLTRKSFVKQC